MTNMKALPMLDHVMLWMARVFTIVAPIEVAFEIWRFWNDPDGDIPEPSFAIAVTLTAVWFCVWLFLVWQSPKTFGRIVLAITAGISLCVAPYSAQYEVWDYHLMAGSALTDTKQRLAWDFFWIIGTCSMIWIAIRPLKSIKMARIILSPNPVNLVNPV